MEYVEPQKFQEMIDDEKKHSELRYKYTLDEETGEVKIAQLKTIVKIVKENGMEVSKDTVVDVEEIISIDYKSYIEKYTMPYEFLINLCQVTQNPEFVYHVAKLARETCIMLVVQDDTTIEDISTIEKNKYKSFESETGPELSSAHVTSETEEEIETQIVTTTMIPHLELEYANTWSFYEEFEYTKTTTVDGPSVEGPNTIEHSLPYLLPNYEGPVEAKFGNDIVTVGEEKWSGGPWKTQTVITNTTKITKSKYNPPILANSVEKSKQFLGLLINSTGECEHSNCYYVPTIAEECAKDAVFDKSGINVQYKIPNGTQTEDPIANLRSGEQTLYQLLGANLEGNDQEQEDDSNSMYKTKMTGILEHMQFLMTFPENEDIEIPFGRDYGYIIPDEDLNYEDIELENTELEILYKVCEAEAGESSESEIVHVASVVLNRVKSNKFPNTIKGVVYQANQFSCVKSGSFDRAVPSEKTKRAVDSVLASGDTTGGAFWFRRRESAQSAGMPTNASEKHNFYVYLFEDPNTHIFYTNAEYIGEATMGQPGGSDNIIASAEQVHKFVRENGYVYKQVGVYVPNYKTKTIDCSSYVTWVLLNAGYRSNNFKEGMYQWTSSTFRSNPEGWQVIKDISSARAGDILCYNGHVEIYAGSTVGGKAVVYNCGGNNSIAAKESGTSGHTIRQIKKILRAPI